MSEKSTHNLPENQFSSTEKFTLAIEAALTKVITHVEYRHLGHSTPYLLELEAYGRALRYIGSNHTTDPKDPPLTTIKTKLIDFIAKYPDQTAVFIEGWLPETKHLDEEAAMRGGEMFYTKWLVEQMHPNVPVITPEPPKELLIENVLDAGFSKEELATWYILRKANYIVNVMRRPYTLGDLGLEMIKVERYVQMDWLPPLPPLEKIKRLYQENHSHFERWMAELGRVVAPKFLQNFEQMNGVKIAPEPKERSSLLEIDPLLANTYVDPADIQNVGVKTHAIGAINNHARDLAITRTLGEALAARKCPFVVFGASHAFMQEPTLREIFEKLPS